MSLLLGLKFLIFSSGPVFGYNLERINHLLLDSFQEKIQQGFLNTDNIEKSLFQHVLNDDDGLLDPSFKIDPYWKQSVSFWLGIYTKYDLDTVIIHDKENLSLLYDTFRINNPEFDFLHPFVHHNLKSNFKEERIKEIKNLLKNKNTPENQVLKKIYSNAGVDYPLSPKMLKISLENIRAQSGQRSQIYAAILRFTPYQKILAKFAEGFKIPKELIAIPFLESSFNPEAVSKVNAIGIWQVMPFIDKKFLPQHGNIPYLRNVIISSLVGMRLLKENFNILKRWDLAVTAYNSGTLHLLKAQKKLRNKNLSLEDVFEKYNHPHLGFASKNFYAEFMALSRALAYKDYLYPLAGITSVDNISIIKSEDIGVYIAKCSLSIPNEMIRSNEFKELNVHLKNYFKPKSKIPGGTILVSTEKLNPNLFKKIPDSLLYSARPSTWQKKLNTYRCSNK